MIGIVTPYTLAARFNGLTETPGVVHNAQVLAMLQLVDRSIEADETPWCSAFVHYIAWLLDLPRARSLRARTWLNVGAGVALDQAIAGYDVAILSRGSFAPGPEILSAPGHVGFFSRLDRTSARVELLGGNQADRVELAWYTASRVLGVRRLA